MVAHIDTRTATPEIEVVIFATCHGWVFRSGLAGHVPLFRDRRTLVHFVESYDQDLDSYLHLAGRADFVFAQMDSAGGAAERLACIEAALRPSARIVRCPPIGFLPLWPQMVLDHHAPVDPVSGKRHFLFNDRQVLRLLKAGKPKEEVIQTVLATDLAQTANVARLYELWHEDAAEKDRRADVAVTDIIETLVFEEQSFFSPYHCSNRVLLRTLDRMLGALGLDPVEPRAYAMRNSLRDYELPVHPSIIRHFGLKYLTEDYRYLMMSGGEATIEEYYSAYIDYLIAR